MNKTPISVLLSDVHFNQENLDLATTAYQEARSLAHTLHVPLVVAGDLHDTKDTMRGRCVNRLLELNADNGPKMIDVRILVGNHDLLNEKGKEHALNFLKGNCWVIDAPEKFGDILYVPYQTNGQDFINILNQNPAKITICHQGFRGAFMGQYAKDDSSVDPKQFAGRRIISGHYHRRQVVIPGVEYIGSPFTQTFTEAYDGPKGIQILYSDGGLDFVPLNLRKHVVVERTVDTAFDRIPDLGPDDKLWMKIKGPDIQLEQLSKKQLGACHLGHQNFKLDRLYSETETRYTSINKLPDADLFKKLIVDSTPDADEQTFLVNLYGEVDAPTQA